MEPIWVVVADKGGAQLLEARSMLQPPKLVTVLENPEGRMKPSELLTDGAGRINDSRGTKRHYSEETVTETIARRFAKDIATRLDEARMQGRFEHLVLIAAPSFLGFLRDALSKETGRRVISSMAKDLANEADVSLRLQTVIREAAQFTV